MKIFISADIEGTTGCTDWLEANNQHPLYQRQVPQMQREVVAACKGAIRGGATEIYIKDAHDTALNLSIEGLPKEAHLIRGWMSSPDSMVAGVDETFDGCAFVGYHAPAHCDGNPLAHTSSSAKLFSVRLNGEYIAEFDLYQIACAKYSMPAIFLSGDKAICDLAAARCEGIITVPTKYGVAGATVNENADVILERIEEGMYEAVTKMQTKPRVQPDELVLDVCFKNHPLAARGAWFPGAERLDEHTVRYHAKDFNDLLVAYMFIVG